MHGSSIWRGKGCHTWHSDEGMGYSYLLPNGNLLLRTGPAAEEVSFLSRPERELLPIDGRTVAGAILELDWDSNVVWEYRYPFLHHDFERLPNGNTLVLTWEMLPEEVTRPGQGRVRLRPWRGGMLGDTVREVTPVRRGGLPVELLGIPGLRGRPHLLPGGPGGVDAPEHPECHP